jgi:hypothetical protein
MSAILASLCVQIPNVLAISKYGNGIILKEAITLSLLCLPFTFVACICYMYFYSNIALKISYPSAILILYALNLLIATLVQGFILKTKSMYLVDYISVSLILVGLVLTVLREQIKGYFS